MLKPNYKYTTNLIPPNHRTKAGIIRPMTKREPSTITIHNTGNPKSTARSERAWLTNPTNNRQASYNYVIDMVEVIKVIPEDEVSYHAGDPNGNKSSIALEICESGDFGQTYVNALDFVARLLIRKGWDTTRVVPHKHWSGKNCPRLLLPMWDKFISDLQYHIETLKRKEV